MKTWITASVLYLASMSGALAAVYELPADGSAVVGTDAVQGSKAARLLSRFPW